MEYLSPREPEEELRPTEQGFRQYQYQLIHIVEDLAPRAIASELARAIESVPYAGNRPLGSALCKAIRNVLYGHPAREEGEAHGATGSTGNDTMSEEEKKALFHELEVDIARHFQPFDFFLDHVAQYDKIPDRAKTIIDTWRHEGERRSFMVLAERLYAAFPQLHALQDRMNTTGLPLEKTAEWQKCSDGEKGELKVVYDILSTIRRLTNILYEMRT